MAPYALAAQLEEVGFDVHVIDYFTRKAEFIKYLEQFVSSETLAIGISSTFLHPSGTKKRNWRTVADDQRRYNEGELWCESGAELESWLRDVKSMVHAIAPNCKFILGGTKALRVFRRSETYSGFDYICIGAGDDSLKAAVLSLSHGKIPDHFEKGGFKVLSVPVLKNQRANCPEARMSPKYGIQRFESLPIEISRGCVFNCKFCSYDKKESIRKDLGVLKNELLRNYEQFGTTVYHFTDDCFNDHREKVEAICSMLLSLPFKIEWVSYARVDVAVKFPHTIDLMVESGARGLFWGLESFDSDVARSAGKGTPVEKVKSFLLDFQSKYAGRCISAGSFIVGLPGETEESIQRTVDWLCSNKALDIVYAGPLVVTPYSTNLDKVVIDYAEYSRDPGKYGFKVVKFDPAYWEHDQMNSVRAEELAISFMQQWWSSQNSGAVKTVWSYPHLRTLGFSHDEIFSNLKGFERAAQFRSLAEERFNSFLARYFDLLARSSTTSMDSNRLSSPTGT